MNSESFAHVKRLFLELRGLDPPARIDRLSRERPEIRKQVERLFAFEGDGLGLDRPALGPDFRCPPSGSIREGLCGLAGLEQVGRYRIHRVLGEGGLGIVFLAEQESPKRPIALKVVRPGIASEELAHRMASEAQFLADLRHVGIAQIHEAGTALTEFGQLPFIAMEYVEGPTLDRFLEERRPSTRDALALLIKIGAAVAHAHNRGIVHLDLKPKNILVERSGAPKIIDFGIARSLEPGTDLDRGLCGGTPPYMSPEQLHGDGQVDTRADVFALGVIAKEILLRRGRMPLGRRDLTLVLEKAIAQEVDQRHLDASELSEDLRSLLAKRPVSVRRTSIPYRMTLFVLRNKVRVLAGASLVILASVAWSFLESRTRFVEKRLDALEGDLITVTDTATQLQEILSLSASPPESGDLQQWEAWLGALVARVDSVQGANPAILVTLRRRLANTYGKIGSYREAKSLARAAHQTASDHYGREHRETLDALLFYATLCISDGSLREAEESLQEVAQISPVAEKATLELAEIYLIEGRFDEAEIALRESANFGRDIVLSMTHSRRQARLDGHRGDLARSVTRLRDLWVRCRETFGGFHAVTLATLRDLGRVLTQTSEESEGIAMLEMAAQQYNETVGRDAIPTFACRNTLAVALWRIGALEDAATILEDVCERSVAVLGSQHRHTLVYRGNLAGVWSEIGRTQEASVLFEVVNRLSTRLHRENHWYVPLFRVVRARHLLRVGEVDASIWELRSVLGTLQSRLGPAHPRTLETLRSLALALMQRSDSMNQASVLFANLVRERSKAFGPRHPETIAAGFELTKCLLSLGRDKEALDLGERVLELQLEVFGERHVRTFALRSCLAAGHRALGRPNDALEMLLNAVADMRAVSCKDQLPRTLISLASCYRDLGRSKESESAYREALELFGRFESAPRESAKAMSGLALILKDKSELEEAQVWLERSLEIREPLLGRTHPETLNSLHNLASVARDAGNLSDAEKRMREVIEGWERVYGESHPRTLVSLNNLARCVEDQGRTEEAERLFRELLGRRAVDVPEEDWRVAVFRKNYAACLLSLGQVEDAREQLGVSLPILERVLGSEHRFTREARRLAVRLPMDREPSTEGD